MIYAMSDIHGCLGQLEEKMRLADLSGDNRIIFLGDYIDYGPRSGQVLRFIRGLQDEYGEDKVAALKGNHEAMLLDWIDEFGGKASPELGASAWDSWLRTDSEHGYNAFRTLVTEGQLAEISWIERKASFAELNAAAAGMVLETSGDLVRWVRGMGSFLETESQIFVHAGVDEEAGEYWKWGTGDDMFLWKFPASLGIFCRTVVAGHVGTGGIAREEGFHDIYFDGASHYYIDGSVYRHGKLLLLAYDEDTGAYYQAEPGGLVPVRKYERWR